MDLKFEVVSNKYSNIREVLKSEFKISSRLFLKLRRANQIYLNGNVSNGNEDIFLGDIIQVNLSFEEENTNIIAININLDILYEDKYLLIVNKPANMPVHPSMLHFEDTLSNAVKFYFDTINLHRKIRIVTRLDKDTSGLVVLAKNEYIQEMLTLQMKDNVFKKEYVGILEGDIEPKIGTINAPIARRSGSIIERCINENGQTSITHYNVIKSFDNMSLVHFVLETGRTHQIRVHSKYIGHPIVRRYFIWYYIFPYFKTSFALP